MFMGEVPSYIHSPKRRAGNPHAKSNTRPILVDNNIKAYGVGHMTSPPHSPPRTKSSLDRNKMMKQMEEDAWTVRPELFPSEGDLRSQLEFLIRYAILAPSIYNSQPWLFKIESNTIEIYANHKLSLAIVDPYDRQLLISCGAAFYHLRIAATHFGFKHTTELSPESGAIAKLTLSKIGPEAEELQPASFPPTDSFLPSICDTEDLFQAITKRSSDYDPFESTPVTEEEIWKLKSITETEHGVWLQTLSEPSIKRAAASLISEADLKQSDYVPYRQEMAKWIRSPSGQGGDRDGVPCTQFGISSLQYWMGSYLRSGNWLKSTAECHKKSVEDAPLVAVLGSKVDSDREWFVVGQTLAKILLCATHLGLSVSQQNQALELPELRGKLQSVVSQSKNSNPVSGLPQVVLRIGHSKKKPAMKHTPRRSLARVLLHSECSPRSSAESTPLGSPHSA